MVTHMMEMVVIVNVQLKLLIPVVIMLMSPQFVNTNAEMVNLIKKLITKKNVMMEMKMIRMDVIFYVK
jgi:hypothetical protein